MKVQKQCYVNGRMYFAGEEIQDNLVTDYMRENGYVFVEYPERVEQIHFNEDVKEEVKEELLIDSSSDVVVNVETASSKLKRKRRK